MVNISSRYREVSLKLSMRSINLDFLRFDIKSISLQYKNKSGIFGAQFMPIGIPSICSYIFSTRKVKASNNSVQVQHLYKSY